MKNQLYMDNTDLLLNQDTVQIGQNFAYLTENKEIIDLKLSLTELFYKIYLGKIRTKEALPELKMILQAFEPEEIPLIIAKGLDSLPLEPEQSYKAHSFRNIGDNHLKVYDILFELNTAFAINGEDLNILQVIAAKIPLTKSLDYYPDTMRTNIAISRMIDLIKQIFSRPNNTTKYLRHFEELASRIPNVFNKAIKPIIDYLLIEQNTNYNLLQKLNALNILSDFQKLPLHDQQAYNFYIAGLESKIYEAIYRYSQKQQSLNSTKKSRILKKLNSKQTRQYQIHILRHQLEEVISQLPTINITDATEKVREIFARSYKSLNDKAPERLFCEYLAYNRISTIHHYLNGVYRTLLKKQKMLSYWEKIFATKNFLEPVLQNINLSGVKAEEFAPLFSPTTVLNGST